MDRFFKQAPLAALIAIGSPCAASQAAQAPDVIELQAKGVQIYSCVSADGAFAWRLKGPEAALTDAKGADAGRHFAGPSWQAADGSVVVGEVVVANAAPGSIPWVLLRAKSHAGPGVFAAVAYIVRGRTEGGLAPEAGCDASRAGREARSDYRASYTFFSEAPGPSP